MTIRAYIDGFFCATYQAKCSVTDGDCTRCQYLRKTCTFSSVKQRRDRRICQSTSNVARLEPRSPEFSIHSSASSSSKAAAEHEEEACSHKPAPVSPPPADDNMDDGERGRQWLAEPSVDDILSGCGISHLSGLYQSLAARTSDDLPSPSSSMADEMAGFFPPADRDLLNSTYDSPSGQSQGSSLFEIGCDSTPTSAPASTLAPTAFSSPSLLPGQSCACLAAVVFAVERFEAKGNSIDRVELDSIVACQTEAIQRHRSMLRCSDCTSKRENLVLLVFLMEKIVGSCARMVALFHMKDGGATGAAPSMPGPSPYDGFSHPLHAEDGHLATSAATASSASSKTKTDGASSSSSSPHWRQLFLGDYEISSSREWEHLVRVLIALQFKAMMDLLAEMKNMGGSLLGQTQMASLAQAERKLGQLEKYIPSI